MTDVVIAGGTDSVGVRLLGHFTARGRSVVSLGDHVGADVPWADRSGVRRAIDGARIVVALGGSSYVTRFTDPHRDEILRTRVRTTRLVRDAIRQATRPPSLWINLSSARIYPAVLDHPRTERDEITRGSFTEAVAAHVERTLFEYDVPHTRRVALRTAVLIGDTPAASLLFRLTRLGLGGTLRDGWWPAHSRYRNLETAVGTMAARAPSRRAPTHGRQKFSWVHVDDVVRAIEFVEKDPQLVGPVNVVAPVAVANAELMRTLRRVTGTRIGVPLPRLVLEPVMRAVDAESELVLRSRWVAPSRLLDRGFEFAYPMIEPALRDAWHRLRS